MSENKYQQMTLINDRLGSTRIATSERNQFPAPDLLHFRRSPRHPDKRPWRTTALGVSFRGLWHMKIYEKIIIETCNQPILARRFLIRSWAIFYCRSSWRTRTVLNSSSFQATTVELRTCWPHFTLRVADILLPLMLLWSLNSNRMSCSSWWLAPASFRWGKDQNPDCRCHCWVRKATKIGGVSTS